MYLNIYTGDKVISPQCSVSGGSVLPGQFSCNSHSVGVVLKVVSLVLQRLGVPRLRVIYILKWSTLQDRSPRSKTRGGDIGLDVGQYAGRQTTLNAGENTGENAGKNPGHKAAEKAAS